MLFVDFRNNSDYFRM